VLAVLNAVLMGTMTAATVQAAVALAVAELAGEPVGFEALGVLAPQAARASTVSGIAARTSMRTFELGFIRALTLRASDRTAL
jgi:hypothetical protein